MEKGKLLFTVKQCSDLDRVMLEQKSEHDTSRQSLWKWRDVGLNP